MSWLEHGGLQNVTAAPTAAIKQLATDLQIEKNFTKCWINRFYRFCLKSFGSTATQKMKIIIKPKATIVKELASLD